MTIADISYTTAPEAITSGFLVFGAGAVWGTHLIYRGIRNDIFDSAGGRVAGRIWFIGGGTLLVFMFIGYVIFAWRQGFSK